MAGLQLTNAGQERIRRRVLLGGLALLGGVALVACGQGPSSGSSGSASSNTSAGTAVARVSGALNGEARAAQSAGGGAVVKMTNQNTFSPATITIKKGETVTWQNASQTVHSATFDPSKAVKASDAELPKGVSPFDSGLLQPGQTWSHTFTVAGTYKYFCIPHEALGMLGTVIVQ